MLPSNKRAGETDDEPNNKKHKLVVDDAELVESFNTWMIKSGFELEKAYVTKMGVCSGWGLAAKENIKSGDVIFTVPRSALLIPENSTLINVLKKNEKELYSESQWVPLLVTLFYEYTREDSKWRPYLQMVPDFKSLDLPMFWSEEDLDSELKGTSIKASVAKDVSSLTKEYDDIVFPFISKHPTLFDLTKIDLGLFKKMVAFIMAYSFTEPSPDDDDDSDDDEEGNKSSVSNPPMMVPLADILNHVSDNNAHLQFKPDCLKMVATKDIKKGEEIFNTYGELANEQLLHMYGYSEDPTLARFDSVELPLIDLYSVLREDNCSANEDLLVKKWKFLASNGFVSEDRSFVVGGDGVLTEDQLWEVLKVVKMSESEFKDYFEKDGWTSDDESENVPSLTFENLPNLDAKFKVILNRFVSSVIKKYPRSSEEEENLMERLKQEVQTRDKRKLYSSYVRCGQLRILDRLMRVTQ